MALQREWIATEAERRKLNVLQKDLQSALADGGSIKAKEHQKQELILAISRIQAQHDHLDKEYREHAIGVLRNSNCGKVCVLCLLNCAGSCECCLQVALVVQVSYQRWRHCSETAFTETITPFIVT
ncbi:hypothetical protein J6590_046821 [Homalodisca vitripennis]|nr:hypothetical protein J6590_046821 [Homalodisca vitripennis]